MGCNCKKTFNKMEKYSDDFNPDSMNEDAQNNFFIKTATYILQVIFGILVGCISICIIPVLILWFVGCTVLRKEPSIRFKKYAKNKPLEISKINNG